MSEFLALVVVFTLRPLIRLACGEPPSPEGEGFLSVHRHVTNRVTP